MICTLAPGSRAIVSAAVQPAGPAPTTTKCGMAVWGCVLLSPQRYPLLCLHSGRESCTEQSSISTLEEKKTCVESLFMCLDVMRFSCVHDQEGPGINLETGSCTAATALQRTGHACADLLSPVHWHWHLHIHCCAGEGQGMLGRACVQDKHPCHHNTPRICKNDTIARLCGHEDVYDACECLLGA